MNRITNRDEVLDFVEDQLGERKRLLTLKEAAMVSGSSYDTLWKLVARKELRASQKMKGSPYKLDAVDVLAHFNLGGAAA